MAIVIGQYKQNGEVRNKSNKSAAKVKGKYTQ